MRIQLHASDTKQQPEKAAQGKSQGNTRRDLLTSVHVEARTLQTPAAKLVVKGQRRGLPGEPEETPLDVPEAAADVTNAWAVGALPSLQAPVVEARRNDAHDKPGDVAAPVAEAGRWRIVRAGLLDIDGLKGHVWLAGDGQVLKGLF